MQNFVQKQNAVYINHIRELKALHNVLLPVQQIKEPRECLELVL